MEEPKWKPESRWPYIDEMTKGEKIAWTLFALATGFALLMTIFPIN